MSNLLVPIVSFPYAARVLGPTGIGKVNFIFTFCHYFALIAALGIPIYGMQQVARYKYDELKLKKVASELFLIHLFFTLFILVIYFLIVLNMSFFKADLNYYLYGGIFIFLGFSGTDWFFSGMENFRFIAIRSLIVKSIGLLMLFTMVKHPSDGLVYFLIFLFYNVAKHVWNFFYFFKFLKLPLEQLKFRKHLPALIVLFLTGLSTLIYAEMDTLLLGFLKGDQFVGYYTTAIRLNKVVIPLIVSFGVVLVPKITQSFYQKDQSTLLQLANQSFQLTCLLGIPCSVGLYTYAPELVEVFAGHSFAHASLTMQLSSPLAFVIGLGNLAALQLLIPTKNERQYLLATVIGLVVNISLNLLLILPYQDRGTALAAVFGECAVTIISLYFVKVKLNIHFNWKVVLNALCASIIFIPVALVARQCIDEIWLRLLIVVPLCALLYFLIQLRVFKAPSLLKVADGAIYQLSRWNRSR